MMNVSYRESKAFHRENKNASIAPKSRSQINYEDYWNSIRKNQRSMVAWERRWRSKIVNEYFSGLSKVNHSPLTEVSAAHSELSWRSLAEPKTWVPGETIFLSNILWFLHDKWCVLLTTTITLLTQILHQTRLPFPSKQKYTSMYRAAGRQPYAVKS